MSIQTEPSQGLDKGNWQAVPTYADRVIEGFERAITADSPLRPYLSTIVAYVRSRVVELDRNDIVPETAAIPTDT